MFRTIGVCVCVVIFSARKWVARSLMDIEWLECFLPNEPLILWCQIRERTLWNYLSIFTRLFVFVSVNYFGDVTNAILVKLTTIIWAEGVQKQYQCLKWKIDTWQIKKNLSRSISVIDKDQSDLGLEQVYQTWK